MPCSPPSKSLCGTFCNHVFKSISPLCLSASSFQRSLPCPLLFLLRLLLYASGNAQLLQQLPDTLAFLQLLRQLDGGGSGSDGGVPSATPSGTASAASVSDTVTAGCEDAALPPQQQSTAAAAAVPSTGLTTELPEVRAARGLFLWDDDVIITRAPGRLDVMGGIADYSGSLVLQMPIAEACHVALQRQPCDRQRLWKHMQARSSSRLG